MQDFAVKNEAVDRTGNLLGQQWAAPAEPGDSSHTSPDNRNRKQHRVIYKENRLRFRNNWINTPFTTDFNCAITVHFWTKRFLKFLSITLFITSAVQGIAGWHFWGPITLNPVNPVLALSNYFYTNTYYTKGILCINIMKDKECHSIKPHLGNVV